MSRRPFSEQIRDAIRSSDTSRYVLARASGISEAALSRFMQGKQGLTLTSLDKLADTLGLEVVVSVQRTPRPAPKGRKPAKDKAMPAKTKENARYWFFLALGLAEDAHDNHFSSRRGLWILGEEGAICLYNNNPYENYPDRRSEELREFRSRMQDQKIKELAYATYPPEGEEDAGYTYALIIEGGEDICAWACDTMDAILARSYERMRR
jgi:transcriptional regulator with XRE-family HTH domain